MTALSINFSIYAGTVDDVRELLGRERIDKIYTEEEISLVTKRFMEAERNNVIAEMFKLGESIQMEDYESDKMQLSSAIERKKDELNKAFCSGVSTDEVLKIKTELDTLMSEVSRLKDLGFKIKVDFEPNPYTDEYKAIEETISKIDKQYDIGVVGVDMLYPLVNTAHITSPFGNRVDPFNADVVENHKGLDFGASLREPVMAQWNGIVSQSFFSATGGNMVVISHGNGLVTRYLHLDEALVKQGDIVSQYDVIGYAGTTGSSTGVHLHFEVKLDDIPVNPIMLYGSKGLNALKTWISLNPNQLEDTSFMQNIKDKPEQVEVEVVEVIRGYNAFIAPTYERGSDKDALLDYKDKMELKGKGFIKDEDMKLNLKESDKESLLSGGGLVSVDSESSISLTSKNELGYTEPIVTSEGEQVIQLTLPEGYTVPNPGFPLLSEIDMEGEKNENIDEKDIENFEDYGQMHLKGGLIKEYDKEDKSSIVKETVKDNGEKEFHLGS